jgi:lysophospholipase L1-like esterase
VSLLLIPVAVLAQTPNRERAIAAFETRDAENPPAKGGILFVGSSSIRFWKTAECFPEYDIINRGFGGSQTSDVVQYMDRIVLPYEPRLIVLYVGDNDIAAGKSPEQVVADTTSFISRVHDALPETRIVYIATKPSLARWRLIDPMRAVNASIRKLAEDTPYVEFVDIDAPMLGADGKPRAELFIADGLHLSDAGYRLWSDLVRPHLDESKEHASR